MWIVSLDRDPNASRVQLLFGSAPWTSPVHLPVNAPSFTSMFTKVSALVVDSEVTVNTNDMFHECTDYSIALLTATTRVYRRFYVTTPSVIKEGIASALTALSNSVYSSPTIAKHNLPNHPSFSDINAKWQSPVVSNVNSIEARELYDLLSAVSLMEMLGKCPLK